MPEKVQEVIAKVRPMLLLLLFLVLVAIPALSVSCIRQASTYTDITPAEAYEMINQQEVYCWMCAHKKNMTFATFRMPFSSHYLSLSRVWTN